MLSDAFPSKATPPASMIFGGLWAVDGPVGSWAAKVKLTRNTPDSWIGRREAFPGFGTICSVWGKVPGEYAGGAARGISAVQLPRLAPRPADPGVVRQAQCVRGASHHAAVRAARAAAVPVARARRRSPQRNRTGHVAATAPYGAGAHPTSRRCGAPRSAGCRRWEARRLPRPADRHRCMRWRHRGWAGRAGRSARFGGADAKAAAARQFHGVSGTRGSWQ